MRFTENTKVRVKVPKHLYEAIQAELDKKHEMEEGDDYMGEGEEVNEYVGMSPDQMQLVDILGTLIASGALGGIVLTAAKTVYKYFKNKMSTKGSSEKSVDEVTELEEVFDMETLLEAVNDAAKKKKMKEAKEKEAMAKKKVEDEKKKKEAEAKKKVAAAKKK